MRVWEGERGKDSKREIEREKDK
jgi:hypothetical protein